MKNFLIYSATIIVSMIFGSVLTYLMITKKQMDAVFLPPPKSGAVEMQSNQRVNNINNDNQEPSLNPDFQANQESSKITNKSFESDDLSINQYSQEQAQQLVDDMPDYVLGQYIDKFLADDAQDMIQDKRRFAQRAVEELYKPNDNQKLVGTASVNFSHIMSEMNADTSRVTQFAKMYAHLDTHNQIPANPHIFIKWVNNQTGQVMLFEKKNISVDNEQNWVSLIPTDGWQTGSYDVRFYQFTSELEPIAQTTYQIYEVIDESAPPN